MKLLLTFPNGAQLTLESAEPEFVQEIIMTSLKEFPALPGQTGGTGEAQAGQETSPGDWPAAGVGARTGGNGVAASVGASVRSADAASSSGGADFSGVGGNGAYGNAFANILPDANGELSAEQLRFREFCRDANPTGDMRRAVVAAEGAQRLLGVPSVDAHTLEALFALAGWPRPHSLVQTMRNAARVKFGWLERVPGRMGFYTVTDTGRETALPEQAFGMPDEFV